LGKRDIRRKLYAGAEHACLVDFRLGITEPDTQEYRRPRGNDAFMSLPVMSSFRPGCVSHPIRAGLLHNRPQAAQVLPVEACGRLNAFLAKAYLGGRPQGLNPLSVIVLGVVADRKILLEPAHDPVTGYRGLGLQASDPAHPGAGG